MAQQGDACLEGLETWLRGQASDYIWGARGMAQW